MNDQPSTPNVDEVMRLAFPPDYTQPVDAPAAEPEKYPAQIGVFCDDCNLTVKGDFIVTDDMGAEARFEVARAHLRGEGWSCTADGDLCPKCAALRVTDLPYTDADLRAEAIRQHAGLTEDPDFVGVGEAMEDRYVPSVETTEDSSGRTWSDLLDPEGDGDGTEYRTAQEAIHDLITGAANTSAWAVNLGADGLEPFAEHLDIDNPAGPRMRIHVAYSPDMPPETRSSLLHDLNLTIAAILRLRPQAGA